LHDLVLTHNHSPARATIPCWYKHRPTPHTKQRKNPRYENLTKFFFT